MKIYISGKISGLSHNEYTDLFGRAEAHLLDLGHQPVNPLKLTACDDENCNGDERKPDGAYLHSWPCYLKFDIAAMLECDAIAMLPNWHESKGAKFERFVAEGVGLLPLFFNENIRLTEQL